ncbi:hypothetical protein D3C78_1595730 [compost metagenome]
MVIRENAGQHKGCVELAADGKNQHLLANGRSPPHPRATGAGGQPVKPGGLHPAGLDATKPLDGVDVGNNTGTDKVADRTSDILQRSEIVHGGRMPPS